MVTTCTRVEGSFESRKFNIMYFYHKLYIRLSGMLKTLYQWSFLFNYLFWTLLTANAERKERTIRKVKVGGWDFFSLQIFFLFIFFVFVFFPRPLPVTDSFFFGSECPCTNFFNLEIPTYWMPGTGFKQIAFTLHVVFFAALRSKLYQIWMVYNFLLFRIWPLYGYGLNHKGFSARKFSHQYPWWGCCAQKISALKVLGKGHSGNVKK